MTNPTTERLKLYQVGNEWHIEFRHPRRRDSKGRLGLTVSSPLSTTENIKAKLLERELSALLEDPKWWVPTQRPEADKLYDESIVSLFYDAIEPATIPSIELRDSVIPLPSSDDGYSNVLLVGPTGAGKTTLLRNLIGTDHSKDRFPSTSNSRTTVADIEIITAPAKYAAAITFLSEQQTKTLIRECIEDACEEVVKQSKDEKVMEALLEHRDLRFRLSYPLGTWSTEDEEENEDYGIVDKFDTDVPSIGDEQVTASERRTNQSVLDGLLKQIKDMALEASCLVEENSGSFQDQAIAAHKEEWLQSFFDVLSEIDDYTLLAYEILDIIRCRFETVVESGLMPKLTRQSENDWPQLFYYESDDRDEFLKQVRWFSANHHLQMGRLLTPMVDGIRVIGPFFSPELTVANPEPKLVLLDGEGIGHAAEEALSISTNISKKFRDSHLILVVDNAEQPMLGTTLKLIESVGMSGNGGKLALALTHFDQVTGDNLSDHRRKRAHVEGIVRNAVLSMESKLPKTTWEIVRERLLEQQYYYYNLEAPISRVSNASKNELRRLIECIVASKESMSPLACVPVYSFGELDELLEFASKDYVALWQVRLKGSHKIREHWARIKALNRRVAERFDNCQYKHLMPEAECINLLLQRLDGWLSAPQGWTRAPQSDEERVDSIEEVKRRISNKLHDVVKDAVIERQTIEWDDAYGFSGFRSTFRRADMLMYVFQRTFFEFPGSADQDISAMSRAIQKVVSDTLDELEIV